MGKFNFMSGGYYGKLGQTVGQRFRNQRVVHAYVVPSNPRTETQQENRLRFVDITGATQLANQLNGGSRLWDSLTNTNFNNRMAEASKYAEQGGALYTYVPLIPYGYEPEHHFEPYPTYENHVLTWTCTDTAHLLGRQMAVALRLQRISNSRYENVILRAVVGGAAGAWTFSVTVPDTHRINSDSWQIGINCDDGEERLEMVYLAPMNIANLKEKITLTLNSLSVTWDSINETYSGTISTSPAIATDAMPLLSASLSGILQGEASAQNTIIQTVNSAGALAFTFTPNRDSLNQRVLFPAGSTCTIPAATFQSDAYIYQVPATTLTFSAALETQNYVPEITFRTAANYIYAIFSTPEAATFAQNGRAEWYLITTGGGSVANINNFSNPFQLSAQNKLEMHIPGFHKETALTTSGGLPFHVTTRPQFTTAGVTYNMFANNTFILEWGDVTKSIDELELETGTIYQDSLYTESFTEPLMDFTGTIAVYEEENAKTKRMYFSGDSGETALTAVSKAIRESSERTNSNTEMTVETNITSSDVAIIDNIGSVIYQNYDITLTVRGTLWGYSIQNLFPVESLKCTVFED